MIDVSTSDASTLQTFHREAWRRDAVRALLSPKSVAVVGANPTDSFRSVFLRNLLNARYDGQAFGVSRHAFDNQPFPYVRSLEELPIAPDVVLAAVGASHIREVIRSAARVGAKATVIFDGGFADAGAEGAALQQEIRQIAECSRMVLVGPNCYGIANLVRKIPLFLEEVRYETVGDYALISNSGGVIEEIIGHPTQAVQWSHIIGTGNEASLTAADFLAQLVDDPDCAGICLFLETIRDPELFFDACDRAHASDKPVVALRVGKSARARQSAATHSGALAVPAKLLDVKLRSHGIVVVDSIEELLTTAALFQSGKRPTKGIGLLTWSGGIIELLEDAMEGLDIDFPRFTPSTTEAIKRALGPSGFKSNPVDSAPYPPEREEEAARIIADDPGIDTVLSVALFNQEGPIGEKQKIAPGARAAYAVGRGRDELVILLDPLAAPQAAVQEGRRNGIVVSVGFEPTMKALSHLYRYSRLKAIAPQMRSEPTVALVDIEVIPHSGQRALDLLGRYTSVVASVEATNPEDAAAIAEGFGFPVAVKLGDEAVTHKSDVGGVYLGVKTSEQVASVARELLRTGSSVLVQRQVDNEGAVEVLAGIQTDPVLGSFLVIGAGGTLTEVLKDVQLCVLGSARAEIRQKLHRLQIAPLLAGFRGKPPVDIESLLDVIQGVDRLGRALAGRIASIDVNPIIATPRGSIAVDIAIQE